MFFLNSLSVYLLLLLVCPLCSSCHHILVCSYFFFSWILLYQYFCCLVVLAYILKISKNLPFDMKIVLLCDIRMVDYQ